MGAGKLKHFKERYSKFSLNKGNRPSQALFPYSFREFLAARLLKTDARCSTLVTHLLNPFAIWATSWERLPKT